MIRLDRLGCRFYFPRDQARVQTVVETPAFLSDARSLGLPEAERLAIVTWIAANPPAGDVIEGSGGARKVRFAGKGKGKSGGYRVITFFTGRTTYLEIGPGGYRRDVQVGREIEMKKPKKTAGGRMIESARQALAFAKGKENRGCDVHVPDHIDVRAIREKISLSQGEFAKLFGLSKRTLQHWEHGRRIPVAPLEPS